MKTTLIATLQSGDYVGFTFFIGSMAMLAATVFFFFEMRNVEGKWRTSLLVSGLITFIAAVHYYYMRDYWNISNRVSIYRLDFDSSVDVRGILSHSQSFWCKDGASLENDRIFFVDVGHWIFRRNSI